jgi:serine protease inhibitor
MINFTDMKHFIIGLMLATAFISCDKNDPSTKFPPRKDIVLTKSQSEILHNGNSFAFNMLRELYPIESQELFISPFSLGTAMSMLANGADGETYKEISSALGYEGYDLVDINSTYRTLNECLLGVDTSTKLAIANGAWLRSDLEFVPAFTLSLTSNYEANVGNLDSSALDEINSWADKNTNGMIPKIIDRIDPDMAFILANALYFKGEWSRKFDKSVTGSKLFHSLDRNPKEMKFMKGDIPCKYSYSNELKSALCEIPFGNKAFALDILLPDDGVTLRSLVNSLNVRNWEAVVYDLLGRSEYVEIPKLDLSYSGDETFKTALQALGIKSAFDKNSANFSKLCTSFTYLSKVIQKTRFKMDEDGAEAASVTVASGIVTSVGPSERFIVDHPFVFAIRETSTGAILFLGAYRGI